MEATTALPAARGVDYGRCLICPDRPAISPTTRLCQQHQTRWQYGEAADMDRTRFESWACAQHPLLRLRPVPDAVPVFALHLAGAVSSPTITVRPLPHQPRNGPGEARIRPPRANRFTPASLPD